MEQAPGDRSPATLVTVTAAVRDVLTTITCRWEVTIMIVTQAISLYVFGELAAGSRPTPVSVVLVAVFGLAAQGLCSVLNDITDVEADKINHPDRPLPSGLVSIRQGWIVVGTCLVTATASGLILATTAAGYGWLGLHLVLSVLYSFPGVQWGRHWLLGPLALAGSTAAGIVFVLSCTSLYGAADAGRQLVVLIGAVCFAHHLLVIPLKDLTDIPGDLAVGRTSVATLAAPQVVRSLGAAGYLAPWVALYHLAPRLDPTAAAPGAVLSLQVASVLLVLGGLIMVWLVFRRTEALRGSKRFGWFAELGMLFLFQFSLPVLGVLW